MSTSVSVAVSDVPDDAEEASHTDQAKTLYRFEDEDAGKSIELNSVQLGSPSMLSSDTTVLPSIQAKKDLKAARRSTSVSLSDKLTGDLLKRRRWSTSQQFYPNSANEDTRVQVKDYMPLLYWAGRFQSRFDRWRTEAITAQLHPEIEPEDDGPLGQCNIEDEKRAVILIFMQLRDLCASAQAANSLHEFEYKYRKDHKLLDTKLDLPPSLRKPDELVAKGPIGRAVRKLTPRKASFANLFKGKGWNRADDTKTGYVSGHVRELQDTSFMSSGRETEDSDSFDSTVQLHSC
ncbi:hypothetical protein E8E12_001236 [Didymella heteroderae]|uniref:Uncharacterized protein n=1 Tax=Didymella heteroderae TaxID=1769908 RepID=A0A9P4WH88_9PLEO|nr:hypothetical protein E8E12_001236 [Didymella heteroderae]